MVRKNNNLLIIGIVLIAIPFLLTGLSFVVDAPDTSTSTKQKVECDVNINDPLLSGPKISTIDCNVIGKCFLGFSVEQLALLKNRGTAKLITDDGKFSSKDYATDAISFTGSDTVTLKVCTTSTKGVIKLTDEDGNTIDSKEVSWS